MSLFLGQFSRKKETKYHFLCHVFVVFLIIRRYLRVRVIHFRFVGIYMMFKGDILNEIA